MQIRLVLGGFLAMVGGFLMIWSGYVSHSILYQMAGLYIPKSLGEILGGIAGSAASFVIFVLELLNALGGIVVVTGGLILVSGHGRTGRIVIILGGGAGLIGLVATFGYFAYEQGLEHTISYAPYWVGLGFTVAARSVSKGSKGQVKSDGSAA